MARLVEHGCDGHIGWALVKLSTINSIARGCHVHIRRCGSHERQLRLFQQRYTQRW